MKLLVGLGNPDKQYNGTYHNMGFFVLDKFAEKMGVEISKKKHQSLIGECEIKGEKVLLAKPQTYMNLSGFAVSEIKRKYGIKNPDIFVVVDDIDLPIGTYRYKTGGSGGTHNGMRNIVSQIGADFPRLRIGIDKPTDTPLADYVLSKIPKSQQSIFDEVAEDAIEVLTEKLGGENV
jgi:PTH1 family peptidyl-tRNA hydrolase